MGRSDEEDGNSFEGDLSNDGELDDDVEYNRNDDGDGDREGDGEGDGERERERAENRPSLFAGDFAAHQPSALSAVRSPRPESAPPQLGADGFRRLTFGNDPLTRRLERLPVNLFGRDEDVF